MSIYSTLLAGSPILIAHFNKGSREWLRVRHLTGLTAASAACLRLDAEPEAALWRDYNLARDSETPADGWRDYSMPAEDSLGSMVSAQSNYNFPMRRPIHLQLEQHLAARRSSTSASLLANPIPILRPHHMREQRTVLDALVEIHKSKGYDAQDVKEHPFLGAASTYLPGKVEHGARESWKKSGLRISPFRLQGLGRV